jgi:hypothetical protein
MNIHKTRAVVGRAFAMLSLFCCLAFWAGLSVSFFSLKAALSPYFPVFLFLMSKIMVAAVIFAIVATALSAKLWRFALPLSAATFLVTWYAMLDRTWYRWSP